MNKIIFFLSSFFLLLNSCTSDKSSAPQGENPTVGVGPVTAETTVTKNSITDSAAPLNVQNNDLLQISKVYLQYKNNGKTNIEIVNTDLAKVNNPKLKFVKEFVFASTQKDETLLSNLFLEKPSKENLRLIYQLRRVNWNSMSMAGVTVAVLDTFDINTVNNEELVTAYYRLLIDGLELARNPKGDFIDFNIELSKLGLKTDREKAIAFYTIADAFSRKYNQETRNNPNDCQKAKAIVAKFPKFGGKALFNAIPPVFEDFNVMIGNGAAGKSFKGFFLSNFEKGVAHYKGCK